MGVTEVSRRVNLHKSTVYRLLSAFEDEGLIARNPETGKYRLGPELIVLGEQVLRPTEVHRLPLPLLRDLPDRRGVADDRLTERRARQGVHLGVPEHLLAEHDELR